MNDFITFGSPDRFEISARWTKDIEARDRLPLEDGWSTGDLRITVGNQVLTENRFGQSSRDHLSWYLSPVLDWLITSWTWLFHEEGYAWIDKSGDPAAVATISAMKRTIALSSDAEQELYKLTQEWWLRHALRAADSSALYPDVYFRRVGDDIEISWLDRQPSYAPDGFALALLPGYATLPVRAVVEPLWQFLDWATSTATPVLDTDGSRIVTLRDAFASLKRTPITELELRHVGASVQSMLTNARQVEGLDHETRLVGDIPAIEFFDAAVLMFGGINVDIGERDVNRLVEFLKRYRGGVESELLAALTTNAAAEPWRQPYEEGYELADEVRDELDIEVGELHIDIASILDRLGVKIEDVELETDSIRGVAVAGEGFAPAILVNSKSPYNVGEAGRRFTLAHELCHILFDRTRAKKLSHVSGAWAPARTEKRANAFAAMFLASASALARNLGRPDQEEVGQLAKRLGIGYSALVEHLFNLNLIGDGERERLRGA